MANLTVSLNKHKKLIIISFLLFVLLNIYMLLDIRSSSFGGVFYISSQDTHPELIEWMDESDNSGKGVFVLKLPRERADQFLFDSVRLVNQEIPDDAFSAFIYINNFENDDIERVFSRIEIEDPVYTPISRWRRPEATFRVFYHTKGSQEYLKDVLHDFYYGSEIFECYDFDFDEYLISRYIDFPEEYINYFSGYELSNIHADGTRVNLEIFINGEKVDFHVRMLD